MRPLSDWVNDAILVVFAVAAYILLVTHVMAADMEACTAIAGNVKSFIFAATGDDKLAQFTSDRSYSHCILSDEVPVKIRMAVDQGTVPATDAPTPAADPWAEQCKREYRSFRPADGTVIRHGSHKRVLCPLAR